MTGLALVKRHPRLLGALLLVATAALKFLNPVSRYHASVSMYGYQDMLQFRIAPSIAATLMWAPWRSAFSSRVFVFCAGSFFAISVLVYGPLFRLPMAAMGDMDALGDIVVAMVEWGGLALISIGALIYHTATSSKSA